MALRLSGSAFITGAASGIGKSTARAFARHGVTKLVLLDLNRDGLDDTQKLLKSHHLEIDTILLCSYVETPMSQPALQTGIMDSEVKGTPVGRGGMPEEISDAILFLASPMASFMYGVALPVDVSTENQNVFGFYQ
ncbi:oxidoreductase short-chain dehydrogenase/reductase [Penicillium malachiteum]|uniref:Oxidoreductase short-chain dehydrogenase/reductase n=1 Tax=Penicillium malachiteum TaxID=1324776 RepID=A0AAD6HSC2_9EURO|nr:oxidoreductase short-chain dehydrogenase/reductase [Penicillium malachiteum]